jgi:hypothetical protein
MYREDRFGWSQKLHGANDHASMRADNSSGFNCPHGRQQAGHSDPRIAWRSSGHVVIRIWRAHGFRWTYANVDSQHLDGRTAALAGSFLD